MDINKSSQLALDHYQAGNLQQAEQICRKILKEHPNNFDVLHFLGVIYNQLGSFDTAINHFKKALQLNPNIAETYFNLGKAFQAKYLLDDAITSYQNAIKLNPNFVIASDSLRYLSRWKAIIKLLQKEKPLILEIGSHVGGHTEFFLKAFRDVRIYCFEPDPRCIVKFKSKIKDDRCSLIEVAVSNTDGTTLLNLSGGLRPGMTSKEEWEASSSIKKSISHSQAYPWLTFDSSIEVKTIKLDTWIIENNINSIDFIWADVQGAERDVIEGSLNALRITKYFFTEYGEISPYPEAMNRDETISLMKRYNFEIIQELSDRGEIGDLLFKNNKL